jgi:HPt (histidine-containing phosphotransfer) domain-containing protein
MPPAPELEDEGDAIDPAALADLRGLEGDDDPDFLRDILLSYLDNAPKLLLAIHAALARSDASAAGGAAHTLKSSSAGVAALRLSAVAKEIERACRAGEPVEAALATRLDVEAARAAARLVELLPESKKEPR